MSVFDFIFPKCKQQLNNHCSLHQNFDTRKYLMFFFNNPVVKYGIYLVQKGHWKSPGLNGIVIFYFNYIIKPQYFCHPRIYQNVNEHEVKQITQK